ncbi:MAG: hypothetical protein ETSY1_33470 [Candidatus Entotheonella factor]|uniref:Arylmalonate decarboxylase n=1 Tax=Entotheonella factor TaxID=1429438 RepID=W4L9S0_ENTF1|nr:MAG: hypothetical protein ETSY1_33470 [Candidatus Entotheonella factor]
MIHSFLDARIGVISPDDGINDDEFWFYVPQRVNLLFTRYRNPKRDEPISVSMLEPFSDVESISEAAETLRITRPTVVGLACNSGSFLQGLGDDRAIVTCIERGAGAPATTITTAQVEALRHFNAKRVAVGGPYPQDVTDRLGAYLAMSGFEVTSTVGLGMENQWQIGNAAPQIWADLARRVNRAEADCIVLACSGIRISPVLAELECELGKPVITGPAVMMWHALRLAGLNPRLQGRGRLWT